MSMLHRTAPLIALLLASCGTNLSVVQRERDPKAGEEPAGVVVNTIAVYRVSASLHFGVLKNDPDVRFAGVDPLHVLHFNIDRQLFGSGKLILKLDEFQTPVEAGVTSAAGVYKAPDIAAGALEKRAAHVKAQRESEE